MMKCCINNGEGGLNSPLPWRPLCLAELLFFSAARLPLVRLAVPLTAPRIITAENAEGKHAEAPEAGPLRTCVSPGAWSMRR